MNKTDILNYLEPYSLGEKTKNTIANNVISQPDPVNVLYDILWRLKTTKISQVELTKLVKKGQWFCPEFLKYQLDEIEQDNFIKNPFEVAEGVLECRCGSKRVYSFQKQTRGLDEPMTTFATCVKCGNKWVYNG